MITVPPTLSVIMSIWMETLVYGFNFALYLMCLYMLRMGPSGRTFTNVVLITVTSLLFLSATGHIAVNAGRLVEGYVNPPTKEAMTAYLLDITQPTNVAKQFLLVMVNLFSDILLTWRVYMVWEQRWQICVIPALLLIGVFISGIATGINESLVVPGQSVFLRRIQLWVSPQYSLSLCMNLMTTLLIAGRIWYVTKQVRELQPERMRPFWRIIVVIIESASVAAFIQIIELAFYESKFPGVYFIGDTTVQIVTMAPLMIIVLVGLSRKGRHSVWGTSYPTTRELSELQFKSRNPMDEHGEKGDHAAIKFAGSESLDVALHTVNETSTHLSDTHVV